MCLQHELRPSSLPVTGMTSAPTHYSIYTHQAIKNTHSQQRNCTAMWPWQGGANLCFRLSMQMQLSYRGTVTDGSQHEMYLSGGRPIQNYTAWCQRHLCGNNLPTSQTSNLAITSPTYHQTKETHSKQSDDGLIASTDRWFINQAQLKEIIHIYTMSRKRVKMFLLELHQISIKFDNYWQKDGEEVKTVWGAPIFHFTLFLSMH